MELETKIRQNLVAEVDDPGPGELGFSLGPGGKDDLFHYMDLKRCECLNNSDTTPFNAFLERKSKLASDSDGQLILVCGFNQSVKVLLRPENIRYLIHNKTKELLISSYFQLKSFLIKAPEENGPASLRFFINQVATLDFDNATAGTPIQELTYVL
jgi:hypothetical protein